MRAGPSQAQTGLGALITGLGKGYSQAGEEQAKNAYAQALFGQKQKLQSDKDAFASQENEKNRVARERLAAGAGGGATEFGVLFGLDPSDPRYHISVSAKQAPMVAAQSFGAAKPSPAEQKATSDAEQMAGLGAELGKQWKDFGFGAGEAAQGVGGKVAQYVPGQIAQRVAPEKYTKFDNTKKILSETALRISTGAATNPSEVAVYKSMLPEPGDSPSIAANKINNFFLRANSRGEQAAARLETQGLKREAAAHRKNATEKLDKLKQQMLLDFGGDVQPTATTLQAPATGGSAKHLSRIDSLGL